MEGSPADKKQAPTPVRPQNPPTNKTGLAAIKPEGPLAIMLEGPPSTIKSDGPPPAVVLEGPPSTIKPDGPPPTIMLECFPPTIKPDGPPPAVKPDSPPPAIKPEGPTTIKPEGPPPAIMPECSPPTLKPECSLSVVNTEGHFTETTPMRELIKEMPGIVFPVDHLCDFDLPSYMGSIE